MDLETRILRPSEGALVSSEVLFGEEVPCFDPLAIIEYIPQTPAEVIEMRRRLTAWWAIIDPESIRATGAEYPDDYVVTLADAAVFEGPAAGLDGLAAPALIRVGASVRNLADAVDGPILVGMTSGGNVGMAFVQRPLGSWQNVSICNRSLLERLRPAATSFGLATDIDTLSDLSVALIGGEPIDGRDIDLGVDVDELFESHHMSPHPPGG